MPPYVYWFLLALILVGLEMVTGTFYLFVVSIAMAVGGTMALIGFGLPAQLTSSALAGITGIVLLRRFQGGRANDASNQNLDAGQPVRVITWREDGTARVYYRGAEWEAELDAAESEHHGTLFIKTMRGSVLILTHDKPGGF